MSWRWLLFLGMLMIGMVTVTAAKDRWENPAALDRTDVLSTFTRHSQPVASGARKTCSQVYPIPEAAKHWTNCQSGQFSQCGGPDDCTCNDADDRLVWYECKEGSYARCEDDHTCVDSCRY